MVLTRLYFLLNAAEDDEAWEAPAPASEPSAPLPEPLPSSSTASKDAAARPRCGLYRCVVRYRQLEVEAHVRLYAEYPLRPPVFSVAAVRETLTTPPAAAGKGSAAAKAKAKPVEAVNEALAMEQQANVCAVLATPPGPASQNETLLHQLLHLRLAVDTFGSQHYADGGGSGGTGVGTEGAGDLATLLHVRQQLRGRERRPPPATLI